MAVDVERLMQLPEKERDQIIQRILRETTPVEIDVGPDHMVLVAPGIYLGKTKKGDLVIGYPRE